MSQEVEVGVEECSREDDESGHKDKANSQKDFPCTLKVLA